MAIYEGCIFTVPCRSGEETRTVLDRDEAAVKAALVQARTASTTGDGQDIKSFLAEALPKGWEGYASGDGKTVSAHYLDAAPGVERFSVPIIMAFGWDPEPRVQQGFVREPQDCCQYCGEKIGPEGYCTYCGAR